MESRGEGLHVSYLLFLFTMQRRNLLKNQITSYFILLNVSGNDTLSVSAEFTFFLCSKSPFFLFFPLSPCACHFVFGFEPTDTQRPPYRLTSRLERRFERLTLGSYMKRVRTINIMTFFLLEFQP